jgi:hypothetical protein
MVHLGQAALRVAQQGAPVTAGAVIYAAQNKAFLIRRRTFRFLFLCDYENLLNTVSEWSCEIQEHDCIHAAKQYQLQENRYEWTNKKRNRHLMA